MENPTKQVSGLKVLLNKPETLQNQEKAKIKESELSNCSICGVECGKILTTIKIWFFSSFIDEFHADFLANSAKNTSARNAQWKSWKTCGFAIFAS